MDALAETRPVIRFAKNFVVEQNLASVTWPQECVICGGPVEVRDTIPLKESFKGFGEIRVDVSGIPYCSQCFPRVQAGKRLNKIVWVLSFVIGIPLGILLIMAAMANKSSSIVMCGVLLALGWAMGYGVAWLLFKLPARLMLKKKIVEPVDSWLIKEEKKDKKESISVVISIPNKKYAGLFAQANGVAMA